MATILSRLLRARRKVLGIWAGALGGVCGMYTGLYPMMERIDMQSMIDAMPAAMVEALGYDDMNSAAGYIGSATYGLVALALLLVFAIGNGGRLIAGQEEDGALELELTSPAPRRSVYAQRLAGLWVQVAALVAVVYGVTLGLDLVQSLQIDQRDLAAATLQLLLVVGFFGTTTFAAGAMTGRKAVALGAGAGLAVVSWMFNAIGPLADQTWMAAVSPIGWYMDDNPITRGFHPVHAVQLLAGCAVAAGIGWWGFRKRDLMT